MRNPKQVWRRSLRHAGITAFVAAAMLPYDAHLAALAADAAGPVAAQRTTVAQADTQAAARDFNIPAEPLAAALAMFRQQSRAALTFDSETVRNLSTAGVQGRMTPAQALQRLLAGTGLTSSVSGNGTFVLQKATAQTGDTIRIAPVQIEGKPAPAPGADPYADPAAPYKADRLSSSKFTEPILNTPRTVTVITKEAMQDEHATTLRDVARSTAGVTLGTGEGGNAFGDRFFIRGFDARNDVFVDGVRDPGVGIRENFNTEQVEIWRGPASSFAGRGTTGGAINVVTKDAENVDFYRVDGTGGFTDSTRRGTIDINRALSPTWAVRLNGLLQYANVAGRAGTTDNRWGLAGAVKYQPSNNFTVDANYSHTDLWGIPDYGVPYNQVANAPVTEGLVPRNTFYGILNRDFTRSTQGLGTLNAAWQVNDSITLENKFRTSHSLLNYIGTIPENPSATGATKPFSSTPTFFSGYVQLNAQSRYEPVDVLADTPQATFKFGTGPVKHTAIFGGDFSNERISIDTYTGFTSELTTGPVAFASSGAPIVSVTNPTNYLYGTGAAKLTGNPVRYKVNTNAGFLMDTASFRDAIILNAGIRYDDYHITSANNTASNKGNWGITSYNVGLVAKPTKTGSVYIGYATAADPVGDQLDAVASAYGGLAPTQNATQIFTPQQSRSLEAGTKWEFFDQHLLASASFFQTNVTNARETAPAGLPGYTSGQIVPGAAYRVNGVDFEVAGNITNKWSVLGGLVLMNPKVTNSIVPTNIGLQLANIAPQSFNLLTKYQLTPFFELGGQTVYNSQIKGGSLLAANGNVAYPNPPNPTILPSYWRFDVFTEAKLSDRASLKFFVQNLTDKTYYYSLYQSAQPFITVAPGRAFSVEVNVK